MKLFVTGGTGFIGSHFLNLALAEGHEVRALRRRGSLPRVPLSHQPEWIEGDLEQAPEDAFAGSEVLVHLAATGVSPVSTSWGECLRWNVNASFRCWEKAIAAGVGHLVICGSCFEYGRSGERYDFIPIDAPLEPVGAYAASKAAASVLAIGLANAGGAGVQILRPFHVYGEGQAGTQFWPALRDAAFSGRDFPMTPGEQIRDFVSVDVVASAFLNASLHRLTGGECRISNVGSGKPQSLLTFASEWWKTWKATGTINAGALPYREKEVMRYVPRIDVKQTDASR